MIENLLWNVAVVEQPTLQLDNTHSQYLGPYEVVIDEIPCSLQPVSAKDEAFYMERGLEVTHSVYTNYRADYQRNWRLTIEGRHFHITGVRDFINVHEIWELNCVEYPSPAKKR